MPWTGRRKFNRALQLQRIGEVRSRKLPEAVDSNIARKQTSATRRRRGKHHLLDVQYIDKLRGRKWLSLEGGSSGGLPNTVFFYQHQDCSTLGDDCCCIFSAVLRLPSVRWRDRNTHYGSQSMHGGAHGSCFCYNARTHKLAGSLPSAITSHGTSH